MSISKYRCCHNMKKIVIFGYCQHCLDDMKKSKKNALKQIPSKYIILELKKFSEDQYKVRK